MDRLNNVLDAIFLGAIFCLIYWGVGFFANQLLDSKLEILKVTLFVSDLDMLFQG